MLVAPGLFTLTFAYFIDSRGGFYLPGAPWLLAALLLLSATVVAWQVTRAISREAPPAFVAAPVPQDV
jgi:MFS transporter, DHA1 family, tetracycline resistance protein